MTVVVCSGFSSWHGGGLSFLDTFDRFWPKIAVWLCYTEQTTLVTCNGCHLMEREGARDFHNRHGEDGRRRGTIPIPGWRQKDRNEGYSWRFDAAKFYKQCLIPYDVSKTLNQDDILVWLDSDIVTFDYVPQNFILLIR